MIGCGHIYEDEKDEKDEKMRRWERYVVVMWCDVRWMDEDDECTY